MSGELLPNFLIVGAAKGGTTSLYEYIKNHPDIFMTTPKEPSFFSFADEVKPKFTMGRDVDLFTDFEKYKELFSEDANKIYRGEASTPYLYFYEKTINNIKKFIPDYRKIKIIMILRNPVDRAYSQYMMKVRDVVEPLSFEEAIRAEPRRIKDNAHFDFFYIDRGMYYNQVQAYLDNFDKVKIFIYDDFKRDPEKVTRQTLEFLGVASDIKINTEKEHNVSGKPRFRLLRQIVLDHYPGKKMIKNIIPGKLRKTIIDSLNHYNLHKQPLDNSIRSELQLLYQPEIDKLSKLIDKDLSFWYKA